jgi:hypothetical protein
MDGTSYARRVIMMSLISRFEVQHDDMGCCLYSKVEAFRDAMRKAPPGKKLKLVHRLDGPYYSSRYNKAGPCRLTPG